MPWIRYYNYRNLFRGTIFSVRAHTAFPRWVEIQVQLYGKSDYSLLKNDSFISVEGSGWQRISLASSNWNFQGQLPNWVGTFRTMEVQPLVFLIYKLPRGKNVNLSGFTILSSNFDAVAINDLLFPPQKIMATICWEPLPIVSLHSLTFVPSFNTARWLSSPFYSWRSWRASLI